MRTRACSTQPPLERIIHADRPLLGYADKLYAASFAEFGTLRELPLCRGWLLERPISGSPHRDALGCYPLFSCLDWSRLKEDVAALGTDLVTLALVANPMGDASRSSLERCFDLVRPFKDHFVADLARPLDRLVSSHHRRYARRALRDLEIERCDDPCSHLDEWNELYDGLRRKHSLSGIRAFSRDAFHQQLLVPGLVMFRASRHGKTAGLHLWLQQADVAYGHLGVTNDLGLRYAAAYGLYWFAFEWFSTRAAWLHLGGSAGADRIEDDGLAAFKRGWASETRTAYFCGRCFDTDRYKEITKARGLETVDFFPAYRSGETL
jgi:hypothetical protein